MRSTVRLLLCAVFLCTAGGAAQADIIFLKNGTLYEGKLVSGEKRAYDLETPSGVLHIPRTAVEEVVRLEKIPHVRVSRMQFDFRDRAKAEKVLARVKKGEDFAKLAERFSRDFDSRGRGGDMGYLTVGGSEPAIGRAAFRMKVADTSGLVESPSGLHIVRVTGIRYQDRATGEFFDASGKPLPLVEIKVRLYQVKETGRAAEDAKLGDKVYRVLKEAFKARGAVALTEEPSLPPGESELPAPGEADESKKFDYTLDLDVAMEGDIVRLSYRVTRGDRGRHKADTGTFQGIEKLDGVTKSFAGDIYNSFGKKVDEEKLEELKEKEKKKEEEEKSKDKAVEKDTEPAKAAPPPEEPGKKREEK